MTGAASAASASADGTERYRDRFAANTDGSHFSLAGGLWLSSIGLGTYLGEPDEATNTGYRQAVDRAIEVGCNVIDTAANYRYQLSERAIGKDERLHRTLKDELISRYTLANLPQCQVHFDRWRDVYNYERPHEALDMQSPISRYQPSPRSFPEVLPPILYDTGDIIRKVDEKGKISFRNHSFRVGKAFRYNPVAIRPTQKDGEYDVVYCSQKVAQINLREDNC